MHAHWVCRALRAGKAVLCEKPAVLNEEEAHAIASVSRECGVPFMEAMKNRFCPMRTRVKGLLASGELGRIVRSKACKNSIMVSPFELSTRSVAGWLSI